MKKHFSLLALSLLVIACKDKKDEQEPVPAPSTPQTCESEVTDGDDPCAYPEKPLLWIERKGDPMSEITVEDGTLAVALMTTCLHACTTSATAAVSFAAMEYLFTIVDPGQHPSLDAGLILADGSTLFRNCVLRDGGGNIVAGPAELDFLTESSGWAYVETATKSSSPLISRHTPLMTTLEVDVGAMTAATTAINEVFAVSAEVLYTYEPLPDGDFETLVVIKKTKPLFSQSIRVVSE